MKKQKNRLYLILSLFIFLLVISFLIYLFSRPKAQKVIPPTDAQIETLEDGMNTLPSTTK